MNQVIAIVGLGYVGLPLAHAFAKKGYRTIGYDVNGTRIAELEDCKDSTDELTEEQLKESSIEFSTDPKSLKEADIVIVALPTPIDKDKKPDITILKAGTKAVGENLKEGAIVVYESTVYPGTTEEVCGPILEKESGLKCGKGFTLGYSPERINPGDKEHTVTKIVKIVSGQDEKTTDTLCKLYDSIVEAGIHRAPSIKVAEMAKAIENAQRDLNIAFVNEIAMMCNEMDIASKDVFSAAKTKWNFIAFQPGLVGGHCIGVDPYYLVEKAKQLGMDTQVIAAGRSVNDGMGEFVAKSVSNALGNPNGKRVLVLGLTFKENVPDMRNSKSGNVIQKLEEAGCSVDVHDPYLNEKEIENMGHTAGKLDNGLYDAVLLLVPHSTYLDSFPQKILSSLKEGGLLYDLKSIARKEDIEKEGYKYLAL
ncbi:nucleotide sugar dehydrogenase [Patescibacteria group bacterium]|nr:nucleotide sugar dehydrogenase [Patescibacteria group bacterium]